MRGIVVALHLHRPDLLPLIQALVVENEDAPPSGAMGASAYGTLTGSISPEDGATITGALLEIRARQGETALVSGLQLRYLLLEWETFAAPPRLPLG